MTPPSGTCLTMISVLGTRTALRSPLRSAASAAARLGCGTATAWPPDSRPASVTMPLIVVVSPTTPILSGLFLLDRIAGSATARATAISRIAVVITNTRVLALSRISLRATSQVNCSDRLGRRGAFRGRSSPGGAQRAALIAPLPSLPRWSCWPPRARPRPGRPTRRSPGGRPRTGTGPRRRSARPGPPPGRDPGSPGSQPRLVRDISAVPSALTDSTRAQCRAEPGRPGTPSGRP